MEEDRKLNSGYSWLQFAIVFFAGVAVAMGMFKVPYNMPFIMGYFGAEIGQASLLMAVVGMGCLITALPAGGVMQKIGVKKFGIAIMICGILECVIGSLATSMEMLIASRVLCAISFGCMSMVCVAVVSGGFTPEKRGLPNGIWVIWVPIAQLFAAQLANLISPSFGWQGEWVAVAIIQAVALILFIIFVKNPAPSVADEDLREEAMEKPSIVDGLKEPGPWLLTLVISGIAFGASLYSGIYPTFLSDPNGQGLSLVEANNIVSIGSFGAIAGSILVGFIINKVKPTKRGILMAIIAVLATLTFAVCFSIPTAIIAVFVVWFSFVSNFHMPVAFAWTPDVLKNPRTLGMASGIMMIGTNIGGALGVLVPSMMIEAAGGQWTACLPLIVGLSIASIVLAIVLHVYVQKAVLPVRPDLEGK